MRERDWGGLEREEDVARKFLRANEWERKNYHCL